MQSIEPHIMRLNKTMCKIHLNEKMLGFILATNYKEKIRKLRIISVQVSLHTITLLIFDVIGFRVYINVMLLGHNDFP